MDYSDGNVLRHYQWGEVHDWHLGINWLVSADEGENIDNLYYATHIPCTDKPTTLAEKDYYNYYSPAGLPISLPKTTICENFSGKLSKFLENKDIFISDQALTSFTFGNKTYKAKATPTYFYGFEDISLKNSFYEESYMESNKDNMVMTDPKGQNSDPKKFTNVNKRAEGDIVFPENLQNLPLSAICTKTGEPKLTARDYCGRACLCLCDACSDKRRVYAAIGVPDFQKDFETLMVGILKYYPTVDFTKLLPQDQIKYNLKIDFKLKIGYLYKFPNENSDGENLDLDNLSNVLSGFVTYYEIKGNTSMVNIFKSVQTILTIKNYVSILAQLEQGNYTEAIAKAAMEVPYLGNALSFIATIDSKEFHQLAYYFLQKEYNDVLSFPDSQFKTDRLNDLSQKMKNAREKIDNIITNEYNQYHLSHCTCNPH
jgi:hypothetical protein